MTENPDNRPIIPLNSEQLAQTYQSYAHKRIERRVTRTARNVGLLALGLVAAQTVHIHPEAIPQLPLLVNNFLTSGFAESVSPVVNGLLSAGHVVSNAIGGTLEHLPGVGFVPHVIESKTPVGRVFNEQALTNLEVYGTVAGYRKVSKQRSENTRFRQEAAQIGDIPDVGRGIVMGKQTVRASLWEKILSIGDPKKTAENILLNPMNRWNQPRFERAIVHTLAETLVADKDTLKLKKLLKPNVLIQAGGEVTEQALKLIFRHVASVLGFVFWFASHIYTEVNARKRGTPEEIKMSYTLLPPNLLPGLAAISGPIATLLAERSHKNFEENVFSYMLSGTNELRGIAEIATTGPEDARERDILFLIRKAFGTNFVQEGIQVLPQIINDKDPKRPENQAVLQGYKNRSDSLQGQIDADIREVKRLEEGSFMQRMLHGRKLRKLEKRIAGNHRDLYKNMKQRFDNYDHAFQLAQTLNAIKTSLGK